MQSGSFPCDAGCVRVRLAAGWLFCCLLVLCDCVMGRWCWCWCWCYCDFCSLLVLCVCLCLFALRRLPCTQRILSACQNVECMAEEYAGACVSYDARGGKEYGDCCPAHITIVKRRQAALAQPGTFPKRDAKPDFFSRHTHLYIFL